MNKGAKLEKGTGKGKDGGKMEKRKHNKIGKFSPERLVLNRFRVVPGRRA
jgi:hypothetical protein